MAAFEQPAIVRSKADWDIAIDDAVAQRACSMVLFQASFQTPLQTQNGCLEGEQRSLLIFLPNRRMYLSDQTDAGPDCSPATDRLHRILNEQTIKKVVYDGRDFLSWIWRTEGVRPRFRNIFDVQLAAQVCGSGFFEYAPSSAPIERWRKSPIDYSLEALASRHLEVSLDRMPVAGNRKDGLDASTTAVMSAARTAEALLALNGIFEDLLKNNRLVDVAELEFRCLGPTAEMEVSGINLEVEKARENIEAVVSDLGQSVIEIQAEAIEHGFLPPLAFGRKAKRRYLYPYIDPDEPQEVRAFFGHLGFDIDSTRAEVLRELARRGVIFADKLMTYRRLSHQLIFLKQWVEAASPKDGRVHPRYVQASSVTGRFSSRAPSAHQVPRKGFGATKIRSLLQAPSGRVLVKADFSTIEMRIMAFLCGDKTLTKAFQDEVDVHRLTASRISGIPCESVTLDQRQAAKGVNFLLIYGGSAETLQRRIFCDYGICVSLDEAEAMIDKFFEIYPGIKEWHEMQRLAQGFTHSHYFHNCVSGTNALPLTCTFTALGRRRVWPRFGFGIRASRFQMYNNPCQGTGADLLKLVLCELYDNLQASEAKISCCIHDEIILEVPTEDAKMYRDMLSSIMVRVGSELLHPVPVKADVKILPSWAEE